MTPTHSSNSMTSTCTRKDKPLFTNISHCHDNHCVPVCRSEVRKNSERSAPFSRYESSSSFHQSITKISSCKACMLCRKLVEYNDTQKLPSLRRKLMTDNKNTRKCLSIITHRKGVNRIQGVCAVTILFLLRAVWSLRNGEYTLYDSLCSRSGQMVSVMWDCSGYVQCTSNGDSKFRAVWVQCPVGQLFDPYKMECVSGYNKCSSPKDASINICPAMPYLKFPNPVSCTLFYDCSQPTARSGLGPWENECPNPLLFDEETFTCVERRNGNSRPCGTRPDTNGKCDHRLGCRGRNCTGLDEGAHFDPLSPFSNHYYVCKNGSMTEEKRCGEDGPVFDPIARECVDSVVEESVKVFCRRHSMAIFADPNQCSLFYNCSRSNWHSKLKPYQAECVYPRLFDPHSSSCTNFHEVSCGSRQEPVQPCDYMIGHCRPTGCIPCVASCLGLRDGANAYPGQVLTTFYLVCQQQRTIDERMCVAGTIFDPQMRSCLPAISTQTLDLFCANNPDGRLPHPSECSIFYSCSHNSSEVNPSLPPRAVECEYPNLVDAGTVTCKPHTLVKCGARREPFSPCDYMSTQCTSKDCTRCELATPFCNGKADNYYPAINQMTADYIVCKDQQVMGSGVCPNGNIFDIRTLTCTDTVYPQSLAEYCSKNRMGRVQNPRNCAQYYDCAISTAEVMECMYPDLYDIMSHLCLPYPQVNCGGRHVFLEPCDSFKFCPVQPCPYCNSAYPSCVGRNGAVGGFRFEPSMYYECEHDRLKLKYCQTTFNWTARACDEFISPVPQVPTITSTAVPAITVVPDDNSPENIRLICYLNPRHVFIKNDNCAQFYNCSRPTSPLGDYIDECQAGALFHSATKQCRPFMEVMCHGRYEPKQVCDYQSMCLDGSHSGCTQCRESFASCINTTSGFAPFNGGFSNSVVHCQLGRVLNVSVCPDGEFYDSFFNLCTRILFDDSVITLCKGRPNYVIPHPLHCAKYIKCGPAASQGRSNSFAVGECPYPLLFTSGLCRSYKTTRCGWRKEAITPCDYDELKKCQENISRCQVDSADTCPDKPELTCTPCAKRYPSCLTSKDGLVHYPGRLFTPDFINCDQGRTLSILKCVRSVFDPDARKCGLKLDTVVAQAHRHPDSFCRRYPKALIPHPTHCARYYNCSAPGNQGVGGVHYLQECRYPRLFDSNQQVCENFIKVLNTVGCGMKFQPTHYCDYASVCPSQRFVTCEECRKVLPSCKNQVNGIHGNPPGVAVTTGFMYCVEGRVLATSSCQSGSMFHESIKSCVFPSTTLRPA